MRSIEEEISIIKNTSLFREIGNEGIEEIVNASHLRKLLEGEFFFLEDDPAETAYVLLEGKVKLIQTTTDGRQIILLMWESRF